VLGIGKGRAEGRKLPSAGILAGKDIIIEASGEPSRWMKTLRGFHHGV